MIDSYKFLSEEYRIPYSDCQNIIVVRDDLKINPNLRLGASVGVPHDGQLTLRVAIISPDKNTIIVLPDKSSSIKINSDGISINAIDSVLDNFSRTLSRWVSDRWLQLNTISASLEECIKIVLKTNGLARKYLNIDKILTAHGIATPADVWPMFRRQANTPYNRLDLVNILAEYAAFHAPDDIKFELMCDAGTIFMERGDLESRPAWIYWDKPVNNCQEYYLQ